MNSLVTSVFYFRAIFILYKLCFILIFYLRVRSFVFLFFFMGEIFRFVSSMSIDGDFRVRSRNCGSELSMFSLIHVFSEQRTGPYIFFSLFLVVFVQEELVQSLFTKEHLRVETLCFEVNKNSSKIISQNYSKNSLASCTKCSPQLFRKKKLGQGRGSGIFQKSSKSRKFIIL